MVRYYYSNRCWLRSTVNGVSCVVIWLFLNRKQLLKCPLEYWFNARYHFNNRCGFSNGRENESVPVICDLLRIEPTEHHDTDRYSSRCTSLPLVTALKRSL